MKKVTYTIDECEYFRMFYELDKDALKSLFENTQPPLRCKYTLIEDCNGDRYFLTDPEGNAMNINDLNGYQRGVVLSECYNHFHGMPFGDDDMPTGCIKIEGDGEVLIRTADGASRIPATKA